MKNETIKIIADWLNTNEKQRQINEYIFQNTELFEEKYESEYREDLFNYFAGKITRFTRDRNKLYELLRPEEIKKINYERIIR